MAGEPAAGERDLAVGDKVRVRMGGTAWGCSRPGEEFTVENVADGRCLVLDAWGRPVVFRIDQVERVA